MLPANVFDELLLSFSLSPPSDSRGYTTYQVIPASSAADEFGTFDEAALQLWYRTGTMVSLERFQERLADEIKHLGHKGSKDILGPVIAFCVAHPNWRKEPTATINRVLARIVDSDLSQFLVLPHLPPVGFTTFRVGHFVVGELNTQRLGYRSERAGSDYFIRYRERLGARFTIECEPRPARVIDLNDLRNDYMSEMLNGVATELWNRCLEAYFQALSGSYFEDFLEMLIADQELVIACGSSYIDERTLRGVPLVDQVSIFLNINQTWDLLHLDE